MLAGAFLGDLTHVVELEPDVRLGSPVERRDDLPLLAGLDRVTRFVEILDEEPRLVLVQAEAVGSPNERNPEADRVVIRTNRIINEYNYL